MNPTKKVINSLVVFGILNSVAYYGSAAPTAPSAPRGQAVVGSLETRSSEESDWAKAQGPAKSYWFKTAGESEAVLSLAGDVHLRMAPGTIVHIQTSNENSVRLNLVQGSALTSLPWSGKTSLHMVTPDGEVDAAAGSFLVKVENEKVSLNVLEGTAKLSSRQVTSAQLPGVKATQIEAEPGIGAEADADAPSDIETNTDQKPDDPNENDDDEDDDDTGLIIPATVAALSALSIGGGSGSSALTGGPNIQGTPVD